MSTTVRVNMKPVNVILARIGVDKNGAVQKFVTDTINRRITRYMPASQSESMSTKLKHVKSPTEIEVLAPYACYQYYGKVMVNAKTGKGPAFIPGAGYRYKKGTILKATDRDLKYDKTKNAQAGPFWDRRMMAAESAQIAAEIQAFVNRRGNR